MFNRVLKKPLINLFKANYKNNLSVVRLNQMMSKLLILSKFIDLLNYLFFSFSLFLFRSLTHPQEP